MDNFDFLCEYFEEYKSSSSLKEKNKIENAFLKLIFEENGFETTRNKNILFGDLYEDEFNITHEQKILFVKWCVHQMFKNFLTEEEYEIRSEEKKQKRAFELEFKYLWDTPSFDNRIEEYFSRTVYFKLRDNAWKFHNSAYFQCQECGGLFIRIENIRNTRQKYCLDCKSKVKNRQNCSYKRKK